MRDVVHATFEEGTQAQRLHEVLEPVVDRAVICDRRGKSRPGNKSDQVDVASRIPIRQPAPVDMFRWVALAVFMSTLSVSAWRRSRAHREKAAVPRGGEPPGLIAGRLVVALPLFGGVAAYLVSPRLMACAAVGLPVWLRWFGVVVGVATVPTAYWVLSTLGSNVSETVLTKERHELVTSGPYRWVRHPLYLTGIALFLSVGLMAANGFLLLWTAVALLGVRFVVVPREEADWR